MDRRGKDMKFKCLICGKTFYFGKDKVGKTQKKKNVESLKMPCCLDAFIDSVKRKLMVAGLHK